MSVICLTSLTKHYGRTAAVDGVSLDVPKGQIIAYLGPNGAGKTTTVKILVGILKPTSGSATIAGHDVVQAPIEVKRTIGYVPEQTALYESLTLLEYLRMVGRLHHMQESVLESKIRKLVNLLDLQAVCRQRLSGLSKGMKQKTLICSALIHNPQVLFLDEPLSSLDASTVAIMKNLLRILASQGKTILYCTHLMDVAETLCHRVVILDSGKIVADGSLQELRQATGQTALEDIFTQLTDVTDIDRKAADIAEVVMK